MPTDSEMTPLARFWSSVLEFESPNVIYVGCKHSEVLKRLVVVTPGFFYIMHRPPEESETETAETMFGVDYLREGNSSAEIDQVGALQQKLEDVPMMMLNFCGCWPNRDASRPCVMWFCPCQGLPFDIYEQSKVVGQVWSVMRN